jgi:hypothetical protein
MRLHMAYAGYGNLRPLSHFGHTPVPYAYRGLSASGFALPWRTAKDPEAYRRDRRKDLMLQECGYCVIRFLAEDVGKYLDYVLDTVLRVLATYNRRNQSEA